MDFLRRFFLGDMMTKFYTKTVMIIASLSMALLSGGFAQAHNIASKFRNWSPPGVSVDTTTGHTVTPFCDGKYEEVASELHNAGLWSYVGLYRLSSGLPKLQSGGAGIGYGAHTRHETRLRDALLLMERSQSHLSPFAVGDYVMTLDLNTHGGETLDWWLKAEQSENIEDRAGCTIWRLRREAVSCRQYNRRDQSSAAATARKNTAFDWLMTRHQMREALTEWRGKAQIRKEEIDNIFDHVDKQSQLRPGVNIWMTHYRHHKLFERELPQDIADRASDAVTNIITCQATPAEYGVIALGDLGLPREFLPKGLAEARTQRDIHTLTYKAVTKGNGLDGAYRAKLLEHVEYLDTKTWAAGFLFLSAPNFKAALEAERSIAGSIYRSYHPFLISSLPREIEPLLFSVPTEHIPNQYSGMKLGHALSEGKLDIANIAALDAYALAQSRIESDLKATKSKLRRYANSAHPYQNNLETEIAALEQRLAIYNQNDIQNSQLPDYMRLTLIAILSNASHNVNPHHRDLYPGQSRSDFLDIYLRLTLFPATLHPHLGYTWKRPSAYFSLSEFYWKRHAEAQFLPSLRKNDGTPEVGFAALVDWEKLESFGDEKRLIRTMAINIVEWLESASPETRATNAHLIAPALYDIIRMCRHEDAGEYKGVRVQQSAFERLHKYYGKTESAKNTPYWWTSRHRH